MAYKKRRTSKKSKCSKKNSVSFNVSLRSRKRKDTAANLQVQKRLDSLLKKRGKFGQSQHEGGFVGAFLAATAPLWLPLAVKGVKKILHSNGKRICFDRTCTLEKTNVFHSM